MFIEKVKGTSINAVFYKDHNDFARQAIIGVQKYNGDTDDKWAGGTITQFGNGCKHGDRKFTDPAKKFMEKFQNVDLSSYYRTMEWNLNSGVLDYNTALAGNPMCMYGTTIEETDRAPIYVFVDTWTSATVSSHDMTRRGVAIYALCSVLSMYRPVNVVLVKGSTFTPLNKKTVQIVPVPNLQTDLARAAFLLCSPTVNRKGMLCSIHAAYKHGDMNASTMLGNGSWQHTEMPKWYAERTGTQGADFIHFGKTHNVEDWYKNDDTTIKWIHEQLDKWCKINA